jgi:predicted tellurium resistance membrane protein TerC
MLDLLTDPNAWLSLLVLTAMEIVLGIDNIVFISILTDRLPREKRLMGRRLGLVVALLSRLLLLTAVGWVVTLQDPLFTLFVPWSGKDLILFCGGVFLLWKATREIYENVEHPDAADGGGGPRGGAGPVSYASVMVQVMLLDVVFSLDSVITAVGMADHLVVMMAAVVVAVGIMLAFAGPVGDFVTEHPSVRILALAFLVLIGVMLIMESTGAHVSKGYIYSAMGFSLFVQMLNIRRDKKAGAHG